MPRIARVIVPGSPHHVTHRGNNRQTVFFVNDDRRFYLDTLREQCDRFSVAIDGYCLMSNHVHLVLTPKTADGLARAIGTAHTRHSLYINRLHGRTGHLWAWRFFSCPLDDVHFWRTLVYIERNPVRAKMVRRAWLHPWSSAAAHVGDATESELLDLRAWRRIASRLNWREELIHADDKEFSSSLRASTWAGRPLGTDRFIAKVEVLMGRRLRTLPRGRPRKPQRDKKKR